MGLWLILLGRFQQRSLTKALFQNFYVNLFYSLNYQGSTCSYLSAGNNYQWVTGKCSKEYKFVCQRGLNGRWSFTHTHIFPQKVKILSWLCHWLRGVEKVFCARGQTMKLAPPPPCLITFSIEFDFTKPTEEEQKKLIGIFAGPF